MSTPKETPEVGTESFSSAVVIPQSYTAYRDETCESASKVPLPTFPNDGELEIAVSADRELRGIIDMITKLEELARKPLNAELKDKRRKRDEFLASVVKEHERLAVGITAFQTAKYLHDQAEERRLAAEKAEADRKAAEAQREIERQQRLAEQARTEVARVKAQAALEAARLKADEAAIIAQSVSSQVVAPANTPRGLTTKVRYDFEIREPHKCIAEMHTLWEWKKDEETFKFSRAAFLKLLNSEEENHAHAFLPPDGQQSALNPRVGIRVFIDVRSNVRA